MDAKQIEKTENLRYNGWLTGTIGRGLLVGTLIFRRATDSESFGLGVKIALIASAAPLLTGYILKKIVQVKMQKNGQLSQALNNELYAQYGYKSYVWGFWGFVVSILTWILAERHIQLSASAWMWIVLFTGIMVRQIAMPIYYRQ